MANHALRLAEQPDGPATALLAALWTTYQADGDDDDLADSLNRLVTQFPYPGQ